MALDSTGVPVAANWPNEQIFQAMMEERANSWTNEVRVHHPLWEYYRANNLIEEVSDWDAYKVVDILARENSTVADFSAYEQADLTPQDPLDQAKFANGYTRGIQMYSFQEMLTLNSKQRRIDLAKVKEEQLMDTMQNHFGEKIVGTQDADGRTIMGIGRIMAYGQACGGIDPTKPGFGYWNPQRMLKADGSTQYSLATELRAGSRRLERLCTYNNETPTFYLCGEDVYDAHCAFIESKTGFLSSEDMKNQKMWTDFQMVKDSKNRVYVWDKSLPAKAQWLINTNRVKIRIHKGANFSYEPWEKVPGKEAKYRACLLAATVFVTRRNANGYGLFT